jgi:hypothetical protein
MRAIPKWVMAAALALALVQAAGAAQEGQIAIAAQIGWDSPLGDLSRDVNGAVGFGLNIAYAVKDWLAIEIDGNSGIHTKKDEARSGDLRLDLIHATAGPRFTWRLPVVDLWVVPAVGVEAFEAETKYPRAEGGKHKERGGGAAFALAGGAGIDFRISDMFQVGILARASYALTSIDLPAPDGKDAVRPAAVIPMIRGTLLF